MYSFVLCDDDIIDVGDAHIIFIHDKMTYGLKLMLMIKFCLLTFNTTFNLLKTRAFDLKALSKLMELKVKVVGSDWVYDKYS